MSELKGRAAWRTLPAAPSQAPHCCPGAVAAVKNEGAVGLQI